MKEILRLYLFSTLMYSRQILNNFDKIFHFGFLPGSTCIFDGCRTCYFGHFVAAQVQKCFDQIAVNESLK